MNNGLHCYYLSASSITYKSLVNLILTGSTLICTFKYPILKNPNKIIPMNSKLLSTRSVADYNVWQLSARLVLLAGVLVAYSYCFLLTIKSIANAF
jgi:hypothetical protein